MNFHEPGHAAAALLGARALPEACAETRPKRPALPAVVSGGRRLCHPISKLRYRKPSPGDTIRLPKACLPYHGPCRLMSESGARA